MIRLVDVPLGDIVEQRLSAIESLVPETGLAICRDHWQSAMIAVYHHDTAGERMTRYKGHPPDKLDSRLLSHREVQQFRKLTGMLDGSFKVSGAVFAEGILDGSEYVVVWREAGKSHRLWIGNPSDCHDAALSRFVRALDDLLALAWRQSWIHRLVKAVGRVLCKR